MPTSNLTREQTAVRAVLDRLYAAWAAGDAEALLADYTEDATSVVRGAYTDSRPALRERMATSFAGPLRGSHVVGEIRTIRFLGDDAAVVVSHNAVVLAEETVPPADRWVLATWTLSRKDGRWLIAAYHNCPV